MNLFLILIFSLFSINCYTQTIEGKVLDIETKKPLTNAKVFLVNPVITSDTLDITYWGMYKYKIVQQTSTDSNGIYLFAKVEHNLYAIIASFDMPKTNPDDFFISRKYIDSNIIIQKEGIYVKPLYLMVTCPFDKTKNSSFCPICKKKDKVVPIIWGLPMFDKNGNVAGIKSGRYVLGGCIVDPYCNPSKTCLRCHKEF